MPGEFDHILNSMSRRVCLIAVPGCGKTKGVLIPKLEQLLAREDIRPEQVLVLTFSRLIALDLKQRVAHLDSAPHLDTPQYILVDEYQDLNRLEQEFVERLARDSEQLMVVGDPDQSIYSFKFAHRQGITDFAASPGVEAYTHTRTRRCAKRVAALAAQLLTQADPARTNLIDTDPDAEEGEIHLVRKNTHDDEFAHAFNSIRTRIASGVSAKDIIVLVPKKKLGRQFEQYAASRASELPMKKRFAFVQKPEFSPKEQERLLLLSLHVNPNSILHARCYLGLGDKN